MSERLSNDIAAWVIQHEGMPKQALAAGIKALIDRATPTPDVAGLIEEARLACVCPACLGSGEAVIGEHFVSHEMAIDAGEPELKANTMST